MKRMLMIGLVLLISLLSMGQAKAATPEPNKVVKVTINEPKKELFFVYMAPNRYIYNVSGETMSDKQAEQAVKAMIQTLNLSPDTTSNQLAEELLCAGYSDLQTFDIRWVDSTNHFYTWLWKKSDKTDLSGKSDINEKACKSVLKGVKQKWEAFNYGKHNWKGFKIELNG